MKETPSRPNILWIFADQMRGMAMSCAGDPNLATPNTDAHFSLAMDEIDAMSGDDRPWFMSLTVSPPHPPYIGPNFSPDRPLRDIRHRDNVDIDKFIANNPAQIAREPGCYEKDPHRAFQRHATEYYLMIENLDENLGRIRRHLEEQGLAEDTIILFFSDHGEMLGSHGRHAKIIYYEESVNIPLIVHVPEKWREAGFLPGREIDHPTCTEDFFPTALGMAGLSPREDLPGVNLTPWIQGETPHRDGVFLECVEDTRGHKIAPWRAYRDRRYKYVVSINGPECLYDLENDPSEMNNRVHDNTCLDVREHMHGILVKHLIDTEDSFYYVYKDKLH